jgi:hypothetical protein
LLQHHLGESCRHNWRDWAFLLLLVAALGLVFAIPVALVIWLLFVLDGR